METIRSSKGLTASERLFIALPMAVFLSLYILGGFAVGGQFRPREACHLDTRLEYAVPRG
jgi:hypothetical protein